jgi:hypothetical protein
VTSEWEDHPVRRLLWTAALAGVCATSLLTLAQAKKDSPAAAATRKKLKQKISVNFKETRLRDVAAEIQKKLDNRVSIKIDNEGGVSNNLTLTYRAKDKPVDKMFDEMFAKNQLGYVIISNPKDRKDGFVIIKKGHQRGYDKGEEPAPGKDKKDGDKTARKDKPVKGKDKTARKDKGVTKDKGAKKDKGATADDDDKAEGKAAAKLDLAKSLQKDGLVKKARQWYQDIIKLYPKTKAAAEARKLLKKLDKK